MSRSERIFVPSSVVGPFAASTTIFQELLELDCDILVPAAIENQITEENAHNIRAKIVVEAANGPTTLEGTKILSDRDILLVLSLELKKL